MTHELNINAVWLPHESIGDTETIWAQAFLSALQPHHAGAYFNLLDRDDQDRTSTAFATAAYEYLLELQHRLDPDHVFQPHRQLAARR